MYKKIPALLKNNMLLVAFVLLGFIAFLSREKEPKEEPTTFAGPPVASVDTHIPKGLTLVPIEIANPEAVSSLLGDVGGVVDLYLSTTESQQGGRKIASRVKMVRAPLNPQQYAVVMKESEVGKILQHPGPFTAVIQNPETQGSELVSSGPSKIKIDYQN